MELNKIQSSGSWGKAADDLNQNFTKVNNAVEQVKNATTRNKGYFSSDTELKAAFKSANVGDVAYVGGAYPYQIWKWDATKGWYNTNQTGGDESVNLGDYYYKEEVDGKFTETDAKLAELGSKTIKIVARVGANPSTPNTYPDESVFYNYTTKKLYRVIDTTIPSYKIAPFVDGAIYTYNGSLYMWDGTDFVLDVVLSTLQNNAYNVYFQGPSTPTFDLSGTYPSITMPESMALRFYNLRTGQIQFYKSLNGETYQFDAVPQALVYDFSDLTIKLISVSTAGNYVVLAFWNGFTISGAFETYYWNAVRDALIKAEFDVYFQEAKQPLFIKNTNGNLFIVMPSSSVLRLYDNSYYYGIKQTANVNAEEYEIGIANKLVFDLSATANSDKIKLVSSNAKGNYVLLARWDGDEISGLLTPYYKIKNIDDYSIGYDKMLVNNSVIANIKKSKPIGLSQQLINAVVDESNKITVNCSSVMLCGKIVAERQQSNFTKLKFRLYEYDNNNTVLVRNDIDGNNNIVNLNSNTKYISVGLLFSTTAISSPYTENLLYEWVVFEGTEISLSKEVKLYELPSYWETYMESKIEEIKDKLRTIGNHGDAFCFITDVHVPFNYMHSPYLAKYILQHTRIDKVFNGGDYIQKQDSNALAVQTMDKWFDLYSYGNPILIRGNHDTNVYGTGFVDDDDFYGSATKYAEKECNTNKKLYFHLDNESQKIRYIFLDTGDELTDGYNFAGSGANNEAFRQAQLDYLTARCTELSSDWTVVVVCHIFFTGQGTGAEREIVISPIGEYIKNTIDGFYDTMNATFAGIISGHTHRDFGVVTTKGYVAIATTCDANDVLASIYDIDNPNRIEGTITEQAFDVYYIDTLSKKIMTIRIGAGDISSDREFSYA